jgi:small subunit ribosomal protein S2
MTSVYAQPPDTTMKALLEAGVHFGHQAKRWNPKMKPYIYGERNGIHLIDLDQTLGYLNAAHDFIRETTANGGHVLFVGTKKQAQEVVAREATRSGQFYINRRWLGGTLTNFTTIRQRLKLLKDLQKQDASGELDILPKQEASAKRGELERLERTLGGMRDMVQLPSALYVVDPRRDHLAIKEARKLHIPIIGIADTNADPDLIDFLIPGNDDAIRSVRLLTAGIADAAVQGRMQLDSYQADETQDEPADYEMPAPEATDDGAAAPEQPEAAVAEVEAPGASEANAAKEEVATETA